MLLIGVKKARELASKSHPFGEARAKYFYSTIVTEDTCAVAGLVISLIATILAHITKNLIFDEFSGLIIGMMLCLVTILLAREFYSLLVGESVSDQDLETITSSFYRKEVKRLIDLNTIHLSATAVMVIAKIEMDSPFLTEATSVINQIETEMRNALPEYKLNIY
ncbi:cation diffusion facilitator family transporter [Streptococcus uberis]|uniref:cation diffusion facilitator family transporter n=1 Tax=Streptococcus uberis TaxID=1349 RepID=UPI00389265FB